MNDTDDSEERCDIQRSDYHESGTSQESLPTRSTPRDRDVERRIWSKYVKPIIDKHDIRYKSDPVQYKALAKPDVIDEEGLLLMQRKLMVTCMKADLPEDGIPSDTPNGPFDAPDDFMAGIMGRLRSAAKGQTTLVANGGQSRDLKDIFRSFLVSIIHGKEKTLPYFLELLRIDGDAGDGLAETEMDVMQRPSTKDRIKCQGIARKTWEEHPILDIKHMKCLPEIRRGPGSMYTPQTLHGWLKDVAPERAKRPGARDPETRRKQKAACHELGIEI